MAKKRKNSTALFEVISAGRVDRKPVAAALKTPRWWFKGQSGSAAAEASSPVTIQTDPADPTANVTAATLYRARQRMTPAPAAPAAAPAPVAAIERAADDAYAAADLQDVGLGALPAAGSATSGALTRPNAAPIAPAALAAPNITPALAIVPSVVAAAAADSAAAPETPAAARPGSPRALGGSKFRFDEDSQEVTLKMRYTTAIVTAFTVLVVVGTAYVIGRHLAEGPSQATASEGHQQQSTAQVKRGPSQPGVMDLSQRSGNGPLTRLDTGSKPRPESQSRSPNGPTPPADGPAAPAPAATMYADARIGPDGTAQRIGNLNYVMILNLPSQYRDHIYEVRDLMTANGIPCTVEKVSKLRGAPRIPANDGWYAVVGVRGFSPKYGQLPEYKAYKNAIAAAAARFPRKGKFEKIEPQDFKWAE